MAQVQTTGTHVASTMAPTAHMPFPPPRARGEGGVTSLLRIVGTAATKALNGPVAEIVLTARRARIGGCAPGEARWGHGSRGYSRKIRVKKAESGQIWSGFALGPIGEMAKPEKSIPREHGRG